MNRTVIGTSGVPTRPDVCGPTRSTADDLARKRYAAAGEQAYVIGMLDGSFPPIGTRIRGEMGGVWAHPIKLLAGYWFALNGSWLPAASLFTSGAGYVQLRFPDQAGLAITRTEFAPDGLPAVIIGLTLRNTAVEDQRVALTMTLRSQLLCAYPWTESKPNTTEHNHHDRATYRPESGHISIRRDDQPWQAVIGSSTAPTGGSTGDHFWGPVPEEQRAQYSQSAYGTGAELRWELFMQSGTEQTLWIAVAGAHTSQESAEDALRRLNPDQALRYMRAIAAQLDLEPPGALPEVAPGPDYAPYGDLTERMMFNQAWSSYGLSWTIIACLLGVQPNLPARQLSIIPHVPPTWPGLAAERLRMGAGSIAVTADRDARRYRTTVNAPAGWALTIGHTLSPGTPVAGVTLDERPADYAIRDTIRGREVRVETRTGVPRRLVVTAVC